MKPLGGTILRYGGKYMIVTDKNYTEVQDNLLYLHRRVKSLQEMVCILESGFEAINGDNCSDILSALLIIKEQLGIIGSDLYENIGIVDSLLKAKGV